MTNAIKTFKSLALATVLSAAPLIAVTTVAAVGFINAPSAEAQVTRCSTNYLGTVTCRSSRY